MHRLRSAPDVGVCIGVLVAVVGTFLPWVRSGRANRNGYATGGVLRRLLDLHGIQATALAVVPYLALAGAVAVVLVLAAHGLARPPLAAAGQVIALATAVLAGGGAVVALTSDPRAGVSIAGPGPAVTLAGAVIVLLSTCVALVWQTRHR